MKSVGKKDIVFFVVIFDLQFCTKLQLFYNT